MAKIIKDCWTTEKISSERKKEFFKKLRDLCCLYSVHIGADDFEIPKELLEVGDKNKIPTLYFEFHNGDTYYWDSQLDKDLEFGVYNVFINFDILPKLKHRGFLPSTAQHRLLGD